MKTKELRKKIHQNLMFASMIGAPNAKKTDQMIQLLPDEMIDESYLSASESLVDLYMERIYERRARRQTQQNYGD